MHSKYQVGNDNSYNSFQVKHIYTFSEVGILVPFFVIVLGLTSKQLPPDTYPRGVLHLKIEGMAVDATCIIESMERATWYSYKTIAMVKKF